MKKSVYFVSLAAVLASCSPKAGVADGGNATNPVAVSIPGRELNSKPVSAVLKASAFKMSGDYSCNVAVTLNADGSLAYFPAPSDLTSASAPVEIGDGWWLNRQGLGPGSVFTKWTFDEYRALKSVPSAAEIKAAVIPGASVTEFKVLPVTAYEAMSMSTAELLKMVK